MLLQAGEYVWISYKEVYDTVIQVGASIRSRGVDQVIMRMTLYLSLFVLRGVNGLVADGHVYLQNGLPRKLPSILQNLDCEDRYEFVFTYP